MVTEFLNFRRGTCDAHMLRIEELMSRFGLTLEQAVCSDHAELEDFFMEILDCRHCTTKVAAAHGETLEQFEYRIAHPVRKDVDFIGLMVELGALLARPDVREVALSRLNLTDKQYQGFSEHEETEFYLRVLRGWIKELEKDEARLELAVVYGMSLEAFEADTERYEKAMWYFLMGSARGTES